jgi:hypothetical protein
MGLGFGLAVLALFLLLFVVRGGDIRERCKAGQRDRKRDRDPAVAPSAWPRLCLHETIFALAWASVPE